MERLEHGGVPVFWEQGTGDAMAALLFRAGIADEAPTERGLTHLVEHLALFGLGRREFGYNGFVDLLCTVFHAQGTQEEVTGFLGDVTRSLADLPLQRFDTELEVLRTEAGRDQGEFVSRMLMLRYGATGFGVNQLVELGLRRLGPDDVARRREDAFTAGNAAVWMYSPEPPRLDFELPAGRRRPPPAAEPLSGLEFPAWIASGTGGVAVAMVGRRSSAMSLALGAVADRLHDRLRLEQGLAYSVNAGRVPLGAELAHIDVTADCRDVNAPAAAAGLLEVLEEFAQEGPGEEELAELNRRADRVPADDPDALKSALDFAATEELFGGEPLDREALNRERREATAGDLRDAVADAFATRIVIVPDACPAPPGEHKELDRPARRLEGRVHTGRDAPQGGTLIVDDAGVYWHDGRKAEVSVPADELAFVTRRRGGILCVFGLDSSWIEIDPRRITDGAEAVATVERLAGGEHMVIPDEPESSAAVDELARETLDRAWEVGDELEMLPEALQPGEVPQTLARGAKGSSGGLIVLTDRRLLFVSRRSGDNQIVELPRDRLDGAEARSGLLGNAKLRVAFEGDRIEFKGVEPKERAEEIADELGG